VRIAVYEEVESLPDTRRSRPSLNDDPLFMLLLTLLVVLASSTSGDQNFFEFFKLFRRRKGWYLEKARELVIMSEPKSTGPLILPADKVTQGGISLGLVETSLRSRFSRIPHGKIFKTKELN
jgi:hypothetical protein